MSSRDLREGGGPGPADAAGPRPPLPLVLIDEDDPAQLPEALQRGEVLRSVIVTVGAICGIVYLLFAVAEWLGRPGPGPKTIGVLLGSRDFLTSMVCIGLPLAVVHVFLRRFVNFYRRRSVTGTVVARRRPHLGPAAATAAAVPVAAASRVSRRASEPRDCEILVEGMTFCVSAGVAARLPPGCQVAVAYLFSWLGLRQTVLHLEVLQWRS